MANGDPIIIKGGGSIEVTLHKDTFPQDPGNDSKHYNADRKIARVEIVDDNTQGTTSCPIPDHGKFTIKIHHSL